MIKLKLLTFSLLMAAHAVHAQDYIPVVAREGVLPDHIANSEGLIHGAEFQDLILPLPAEGMTTDTWGAETSKPRSTKFGIEHPDWSYWGGGIHFLETTVKVLPQQVPKKTAKI